MLLEKGSAFYRVIAIFALRRIIVMSVKIESRNWFTCTWNFWEINYSLHMLQALHDLVCELWQVGLPVHNFRTLSRSFTVVLKINFASLNFDFNMSETCSNLFFSFEKYSSTTKKDEKTTLEARGDCTFARIWSKEKTLKPFEKPMIGHAPH